MLSITSDVTLLFRRHWGLYSKNHQLRLDYCPHRLLSAEAHLNRRHTPVGESGMDIFPRAAVFSQRRIFCCAIRIPHAKQLVPNGTSSPELPLASWLHASFTNTCTCHHLPVMPTGASPEVPTLLGIDYLGMCDRALRDQGPCCRLPARAQAQRFGRDR
jgi:hypothetical protein